MQEEKGMVGKLWPERTKVCKPLLTLCGRSTAVKSTSIKSLRFLVVYNPLTGTRFGIRGIHSEVPPALALSSHRSSFYSFIIPLYRCSATWNFNWTIRSKLQTAFPVWQILYRAFGAFTKCETFFRNMVSPTSTAYSLFSHSTVIRNFLNRLSHSTFHHSSNLPISRLAYTTRATVTSFFSSSTHSELIVKYLEEKNPSIPISTLV